MHRLVEKYIQDKEAENTKISEQNKRKFLLSHGLCEKVYVDKSEVDDSDEYTSEYENGKVRYYKLVPVDVTDEEYTRLISLSKSGNADITEGNGIATLLVIVALIVYVAGFFMGIGFGNVEVTTGTYYTHTETVFSWGVAFLYWIGTFLCGSLFLGIAEIIKLLQDIKNKK